MEQFIEKWDEIKQTVRKEHGLTEMSYTTWLKPLQLFDVKKDLISVAI